MRVRVFWRPLSVRGSQVLAGYTTSASASKPPRRERSRPQEPDGRSRRALPTARSVCVWWAGARAAYAIFLSLTAPTAPRGKRLSTRIGHWLEYTGTTQRPANSLPNSLPGPAMASRAHRSVPLSAGKAFQVRVWRALLRVPPGALVSYGRLAEAVAGPQPLAPSALRSAATLWRISSPVTA